jgi:hypothetical protein
MAARAEVATRADVEARGDGERLGLAHVGRS